MKLIFIITILILSFGGGLFITSRYREDDSRLTIGFLLLLTSLGTITFFAGFYFHMTKTLLYNWKGGMVTGAQLMIVGAVIAGCSIFYAIRAIREKNNEPK
jgi:hypothetical protein